MKIKVHIDSVAVPRTATAVAPLAREVAAHATARAPALADAAPALGLRLAAALGEALRARGPGSAK